MVPFRILGAALLALLAASPVAARAASLQPIGKFTQPIYVTSAPDNGERLFVVEREGEILEVRGGVATAFADLRSQVGCNGECKGERGLLSVALAPDFGSSGRLYVDYAQNEDGSIHVAELTAGPGGAPSSSLRNLLTIPHSQASNHNGGQLQFGPDGYLYVSTGDGGGGDDQFHNAQNLNSLLGKILRIDPRPSGALPYTVPPGNPFPAAPAPANAIWAYGLRNPFRFSFDRATGALLIGDVGQNKREEVDVAPAGGGAGANYGWNCREGLIAGPATDSGCGGPTPGPFVEPVFDYPHEDPGGGKAHGCAIIGGYAVRDGGLGGLAGRYLYADLCVGELRSFDLAKPAASDSPVGITVPNLNSFGEDACGRLYTVSGDGQVARLVGEPPTTCPLRGSFIGLRTASRRVVRGRRAAITAFVSPCPVSRRGQTVTLSRAARRIATAHLDRACTARFLPRVRHRGSYRASIASDGVFEASTSRALTIKPVRRHRRRR